MAVPETKDPGAPVSRGGNPFGPAGFALAGLVLAAVLVGGVTAAAINRRTARQAAEAERRRIQQEIHDGLQQTVVGLQAQLETLESHPELAPNLASRLSEQSQVLLQEVRAVTHGSGVATRELDQEIQQAAEALQSCGIPVLHKVVGNPWNLTPLQAHEVAMVLREALTNIRKHGRGTVGVLVFLHFAEQSLTLEVVDTGQGFDEERAGEGVGLRNMRERAKRLGGQLEIRADEQGTTIQLVVPRKGANG